MSAAYIFYEVHQNWHIDLVLSIATGLATSALIGVAFYYLVMRRLGDASNLVKVVATLALLLALQETVVVAFGTAPRLVASSLPTGTVLILGARVGVDRLWIFAIVVVLTSALWLIYRFTRFGLATSAVAENPTAAASLEISPNSVAAANWAIGAALGGLAAILLVPITGLSGSNLSLIVIPILAAAVIGEFSSFPITTIAGLAMGVAQSEVTRYVSSPGWDIAVPFLFVTIVLYLRGRSVAGRDESFGRLPSLGTGKVPPYMVGISVVISLFCIWSLFPFSWLVALQYQMAFGIILVSLVVVTGYAGQVSLAQVAFAGVGALVAAWLFSSYGIPFAVAMLAGIVAVIPVGVIIAFAGVRTRGVALAIVTLGFAFSLEAVVFSNPKYTGGLVGYHTAPVSFFGLQITGLVHPARYATFTLILLVLVSLAVANLRRGRAGRRLIAVRTNERAAAAMGISVTAAKTYAFTVGGMIAAAGGIVLAFYYPTADFTNFAGLNSITATETSVLGGVGHLGGPLIASGFQPNTLPTQIFSFFGGKVATYIGLLSSVMLLVFLPTMPDGLAAETEKQNANLLSAVRRRLPKRRPAYDQRFEAVAMPVRPSVTLTLQDVSVTFGGTTALDSLSLELRSGEVVGLIGPNGAGKTTAIDAITGFVSTAGGRILLDGVDIGRWRPDRRARAGLARSFQSLELFDDLSVLENMQAAADSRDWSAYAFDLFRPSQGRLSGPATIGIRDFDLVPHLATQVRRLSYAQRRLLAVARAIASGAPILLLDEPASGLGDAEVLMLSDAIRRLSREHNLGVLLIEHNVDMVLRTCDRITALNFGLVIGTGTPSQIRSNPDVIEAYLGTSHLRGAEESDFGQSRAIN
jgi:sulfate-transporting ATPase